MMLTHQHTNARYYHMSHKTTLEQNYPKTTMKLKVWADWAARGGYCRGYPTMSIEQAAHGGGGIDTRGSGMYVVSNPEAEEMELVLIELKNIELKQFLAIKFYFGDETMTFKRMGKILGFQRSNAYKVLSSAVAWVDLRIN